MLHLTPHDCYYLVGEDRHNVLSSKRMTFVPVGDTDYQSFLASGMHPKWSMDVGALGDVLLREQMPRLLSEGLTVDFVNNPDDSGTYPLHGASFEHLRQLAVEHYSGMGLPDATVHIADINGHYHVLEGEQVGKLYKACRDYVAQMRAYLIALAHNTSIAKPQQPWRIE